MADHVTADPGAPAPPTVVEFTSELTPLLLTQVLAAGAITDPIALTIMLAGPLFLAMGALMHGTMLLQWGYTFLIALPAVPLLSFGMAWINAHRKSSAEVLRPVHVRAGGSGLEIEVGEESREAEWSAFSRWRRLAGTYLLYTTPRSFMVLRADELDAGALAAFEALLRAKVASGPRR